VRAHGQDRIAGIDFVGGAVKLGETVFGTLIGPGFLDHFADLTVDDLPTDIRTMRSFVAGLTVTPLPAEELETALCWNMNTMSVATSGVTGRYGSSARSSEPSSSFTHRPRPPAMCLTGRYSHRCQYVDLRTAPSGQGE